MYSIASVFNEEGNRFWEQLENRCESSQLKKTPIPHFSWQTADSYDIDPLKADLDNLCKNIRPFTIHTSGMGVFPSDRKILFLIVVKDRNLLDLHELIWENTILYARQPNMLYSPDNWVPHISLNLSSLEVDKFSLAVEELTCGPLDFEIQVNRIGLLYLTMLSSGIETIYDLSDSSMRRV